jgi:hypothetical protein
MRAVLAPINRTTRGLPHKKGAVASMPPRVGPGPYVRTSHACALGAHVNRECTFLGISTIAQYSLATF